MKLIFKVSAAVAVIFSKKSAAAAQSVDLGLYFQHE
jgi:hypothetical protein